MSQIKEEFIYRDIDYLESPFGWLDARISNRIEEGFAVWRDEKELAWRGVKIE